MTGLVVTKGEINKLKIEINQVLDMKISSNFPVRIVAVIEGNRIKLKTTSQGFNH